MSRLPVKPSSFSTATSTGSPWQSQPPLRGTWNPRSEEHTSELQSHVNLVCRLLLEKKKNRPNSDLCERGVIIVSPPLPNMLTRSVRDVTLRARDTSLSKNLFEDQLAMSRRLGANQP